MSSSFIFHLAFRLFAIYTIIAAIVAIWFGYVAATENDGRKKGRAYLIASLLFSFWLSLEPLLWLLYEHSLPIFEFQGKIASVKVLDSSSKYYSAWLSIQTTTGGTIDVHASDRSDYLRPGERLLVRYRGDTGELVKASFYSDNGQQQGVLQSTRTFEQTVLLLLGIFCIWASLRKYRRDPEGQENSR